MTRTEMHSYFDLALDKAGSPYFEDTEKDEFLNFAERLLFNGIVRGGGQVATQGVISQNVGSIDGLENSSFSSEAISACVEEVTISSDSTGKITYAAINAIVPTEFYHLSTILRTGSDSADRSCRYVEINDYAATLSNALKVPTDKDPIYRNIGSAIHVDPKTAADFVLTVYRTPRGISATQDSELLESTHEKIIYNALVQAGINLRESDFYQMVKQESTTEA